MYVTSYYLLADNVSGLGTIWGACQICNGHCAQLNYPTLQKGVRLILACAVEHHCAATECHKVISAFVIQPKHAVVVLPRWPLGSFFSMHGSDLPDGEVISASNSFMSYSSTERENSLACPIDSCAFSLPASPAMYNVTTLWLQKAQVHFSS